LKFLDECQEISKINRTVSIGYFTAQNSEYAIAINYRRTQNIGLMSLIQNAMKTIKLYYPASYLVRHIFDSNQTSTNAYEMLKYTELISPVYFTLCPINYNPQIIVRSSKEHSIVKCKNGYVSQTNIDEDDVGDNIMWSIERKAKIKEIMETKIFTSTNDLLQITDFPIINHETVYVCVMSPSDGIIGFVTK